MVERWGFDPHSGRRVVSLSKIHLPLKEYCFKIPRKRWLRPDMTEKIVDWDVKPQPKQTKTKLHNIHVQSYEDIIHNS